MKEKELKTQEKQDYIAEILVMSVAVIANIVAIYLNGFIF